MIKKYTEAVPRSICDAVDVSDDLVRWIWQPERPMLARTTFGHHGLAGEQALLAGKWTLYQRDLAASKMETESNRKRPRTKEDQACLVNLHFFGQLIADSGNKSLAVPPTDNDRRRLVRRSVWVHTLLVAHRIAGSHLSEQNEAMLKRSQVKVLGHANRRGSCKCKLISLA